RPRLRVTQRFTATPPPLAPHQPRRAPEAREITDLHRPAFVRLRTRAALRAARELGNGLDGDHQLVSTRNPGSPSNASASPIPSLTQGSPRRRSLQQPQR